MIPDEEYCYLTTRGRRTGRPHTIEIWYVSRGDTVFVVSGGGDRADWVRNLRADPAVTVRIGDRTYPGVARVVDDPEADRAMAARYQGGTWVDEGTTVAVDLDVSSPAPPGT